MHFNGVLDEEQARETFESLLATTRNLGQRDNVGKLVEVLKVLVTNMKGFDLQNPGKSGKDATKRERLRGRAGKGLALVGRRGRRIIHPRVEHCARLWSRVWPRVWSRVWLGRNVGQCGPPAGFVHNLRDTTGPDSGRSRRVGMDAAGAARRAPADARGLSVSERRSGSLPVRGATPVLSWPEDQFSPAVDKCHSGRTRDQLSTCTHDVPHHDVSYDRRASPDVSMFA